MSDPGTGEDLGLDGRTILHVVPALAEGRISRTVLALAEAAAAAGARPIVAAEKGPLVGDLQAAGGEWVAFDLGGWSPVAAIGNIAHLRGLFDREAVDLVHVHAHVRFAALSGLLAARIARIPVIASFHGPPAEGFAARRLDRALLGARLVTAPSRHIASDLKAASAKRADRIVGISPGLDLTRFAAERVSARERADFRAIAGLEGSERVVIHHARFHPDKGQMVLVDAVRLLVNGGLDGTVFLIVCDGPDEPGYRAMLDERIRVQGLDGMVRLVAASEAGPAALASAHLAVAPSVAPDPVGRSVVEAMAMGLPVVASDIGALRDLVTAPPSAPAGEDVGFRVPADDAMALAEAIGRAVELDPKSRIAMSGRAAARARRFSRPRLQDQMIAIYRRILADAG
jgi:glycosyltransferase involved in cell wall biosynthesis